MGDLDFDELDKAINELYETLGLDDEPDNGAGAQSMSKDDDSNRPVADGDDNKSTDKSVAGPAKSSKRRPIQDVRRPVASNQEQSNASSDTTNSSLDDGGHGRFMDMVHPSSDTQLQHKHNFASERQAELDAKLATEAESAESNQDDTKSQEPVQIAISIEEDDAAIESTTKPTSIQIDDSDNIEIGTEAETKPEPESESQTEAEPESKAVAETGESSVQSTTKPQVTTAGRRGVQYRGDNRRTRHDLAQPLPVTPVALSASEVLSDDVGAKQYDTPFLPDAKVSKRPLGQVNRRLEAAKPKAASNQSTDNHQSETSDVKLDVVAAKPTKSKTSEVVKSRHETKPHQAMSRRDYTRLHQTESGQPVASRHSVSTSDDGLTLNTRRSKTLVIIGRILLFLAIIIIGGLTGMAFYYYGG